MIPWDAWRFWLHLKFQTLAHHWPQTVTLGDLVPLLFLSVLINFGIFAGNPLFARFQRAPIWLDKKKSYCLPGDRVWPHLLWALYLGCLIKGAHWWQTRLAMPLIALNSLGLMAALFLPSLPLNLCGVAAFLLLTVAAPLAGGVKMTLLLPTIDLELQQLTAAGR